MTSGGLNYSGAGTVSARLESLIETQRVKLVGASTAQERRDAWYLMKSLIESRSALQVRRMEVARGLSSRRAGTI